MYLKVNHLIGFYIIISPITSLFAISGRLRLPIIFLLLLIVFLISIYILSDKGRPIRSKIFPEDLFLIFFLSLATVSFVVNITESVKFSHLVALYFSVFILFITTRSLILTFNVDLLKSIYYSYILITIITILDFVLVNLGIFKMREYFVNPEAANMTYYIIGAYKTTGGVAEEPGSMALFIFSFFPLAFYYSKVNRVHLGPVSIVLLAIGAAVSTSSTGGIVFLVASIIVSGLLLFLNSKIGVRIIFISLLGIIIITYVVINFKSELSTFYQASINKINLSSSNVSSSERSIAWLKAVQDWKESPIIGKGPGYGKSTIATDYLSVYLKFFAEIGMSGILFYLLFLAGLFIRVFSFKNPIRPYLFISLLYICLHMSIIGDYYVPVYWIVLFSVQLLTNSNIKNSAYKFENLNSHT